MKRVLVAGATGYLGGFVARELKGDDTEIDVGGPQTMTWCDMARLAFDVLGRPAKLTRLPARLMWSVVRLVRLLNRHQAEMLAMWSLRQPARTPSRPTSTHSERGAETARWMRGIGKFRLAPAVPVFAGATWYSPQAAIICSKRS